jgi:hypothetical protein
MVEIVSKQRFPILSLAPRIPKSPRSHFAGAVEVFSVNKWGRSYVALVGTDTPDVSKTDPFELAVFFVMASFDGTMVTLQDGTVTSIRRG